MGADETVDTFFRCPRCQLPHLLGTSACPVTGAALEPNGADAPGIDPTLAATVQGAASALAADDEVELVAGQILDGKYAVGEIIGSGAMGTVYEATHVLLGRKVAIKTLGSVYRQGLEMSGRFLAEGRVLASLAHPHVIHVYDLGLERGQPYLVMERLEGETLDERLDRLGTLPIAETLIIARQILSGLGAVHERGIVHRDLKPANVFLAASSDGLPHVKILDFGVSTSIVGEGASHGQIIGTPAFLAPEQARGEAVDERVDLWALAVCLYQMLTGARPFSAGSINQLLLQIINAQPPPPSAGRRGVPVELDEAVMRALQKRRDDRFPSARAMFEALAHTGSGGVVVSAEPARELALVAEPDPHVAEAYAAVARELGLVPIVVEDGAEAREMIASIGLPRLLLTNLSLPGEDGFALLRGLRALAPASVCAAVAFSPMSEIRAAARARRRELGLAAVLDSDAAPDAVLGVARRALAGGEPDALGLETSTRPPDTETRRLERIAVMDLVDERPADAALQHLVEDTAHAFGVPVALISLVLQDRQWFKAHVGIGGELLTARGSPRDWAFCRHVVESRAPLIVPDARAHPAFADNPLVLDGTVGSYAGAPVITPRGDVLGSLCIIDSAPSPFSADQVEDLVHLARRVAGELELRAPRRAEPAVSLAKVPSTMQHRLMAILANLDCAVLLLDGSRRVVFANQTLADLAGVPVDALLGKPRDAFVALFAPIFDDPADYRRRIDVLPAGPYAGREDFGAKGPARRILRWSAKPVEMKDGIGQLETYAVLAAA